MQSKTDPISGEYNLEKLEEDILKKESAKLWKKKMKISGKSVFKLQEIIKRKPQINKSDQSYK